MSGWGQAEGKINKLIFVCDGMHQAMTVKENAENRGDQKHINIRTRAPYYDRRRYLVQVKTIEDYPEWYKPGYFSRDDN